MAVNKKKSTDSYAFLKDKNYVKRILFTFALLAVYRIGSSIPVPGIDASTVRILFSQNTLFGLMNMMGGGSLERMSIFAMGVGPYITASIIIQLLSMDVIPALSDMREEGKKGQAKLNDVTKYLGLILTVIQAASLVYGFDRNYHIMSDPSTANYLFVIIVMTAGSMILVWFGDQIAMKGIGNGISMIIFAGIVSNIPAEFVQAYQSLAGGGEPSGYIAFAIYIVTYITIILLILVMELAKRKIPVHYAGKTMNGSNMTYIPIKINSASVLPVIFASSVITAPQILLSFFSPDTYTHVSGFLSFSNPVCLIIYAFLIVFFEFFYTDLQLAPDEIAKNLNKSNGFIPGVRAGSETTRYIKDTIHKVTVFGAIGLLIVALIPHIIPLITPLPSSFGIGGTGLIIVVGVALETLKQLTTENTQVKYKDYVSGKYANGGFLK